jgi:hypothetical protein
MQITGYLLRIRTEGNRPVMKKKLYIETSVWNQLEHDDRPDWRDTAEKFIATLQRGFYEVYVSKVVLDELLETPDENRRRKLIGHISSVEPVILPFDEEAQSLTDRYMIADQLLHIFRFKIDIIIPTDMNRIGIS